MLTKPLLLLGALAASGVVAQLPHALQARVLDDLDESPTCSSARDSVLSVYQQMPTPAAVLDDAALPTGVCEEPSFTGETAAAWSSFTSAAIAVLASNTAVVASAFSACPELLGRLPEIPDCVATAAPTPAPTGAGAGKTTAAASAGATGSAEPSASGTQSGAASSPSPDQNAAPRLGAIVGTLWGAAGLVGAVAAL